MYQIQHLQESNFYCVGLPRLFRLSWLLVGGDEFTSKLIVIVYVNEIEGKYKTTTYALRPYLAY